MSEPGIDDRRFDCPITDHTRFRRRSKARVKLPGEYAEFQLSDGRPLGEVMGGGFFGPASESHGDKPIVKSIREQSREDNSPLARIMRDDPPIAPRGEPAGTPGGFGAFSGAFNEEPSPSFPSGFSAVNNRYLQGISDTAETPAPEEQEIAGVERSRAGGMTLPPFEMSPPLPRVLARRDPAGGWWHGASRDGGTRQHNGVDLLAEPGTSVRSPIDGTVHRINYTSSGMATITLRNDDGQEVKFLYVAPVDGQGRQLLEPGAIVRAGQIIGSVEDLGEGYGDARTGRMKNHVHMRISENGQPVDPFPWLAQWWANPEGSGKNWYPRRHSAVPGIGNAPDYDAVSEGQRWRRERERR